LAAKNYVTTDSKIGSENCVAVDVSLPIQKLAARNCVATDSKISSDGGVISALLLFFVFTMKDLPLYYIE